MSALQFIGSDFGFTKGLSHFYRSSEFARRGFCVACGSSLVFVSDHDPYVWVTIGTLDHPGDWPLTAEASWGQTMHVHIDNKIAWSVIDNSLPQLTSETEPYRDAVPR
ncbi:hypothetical protein BC361_32745 [Ensifer sp. LC54]|nr:hypothetical protein BC361_32745 [Ensifer sp. LC54]OCP17911.1 hypothetical protein BC363_32870 [Ensifer sp. LC384]